jgi:F1F0 ATPase subunit 2
MVIDWAALTLALGAGLLLGALFFGGLWWTVRKAISSANPALWFSCSRLARLAMVLAGFYGVGSHHWERLLMCLFGFVAARLGVTWLTAHGGAIPKRPIQGASHAP